MNRLNQHQLAARSCAILGLCAGLSCSSGGTTAERCDPDTFPGDSDCVDSAGVDAAKGDAWSSTSDPSRFAQDLNYQLDQLPMAGQSERVAWASTYWPTYEDSTNVRWQGANSLSPLEKYDAAFHSWDPMTVDGLHPMTSCGATYDASYYENLGPAAKWMTDNKGNGRMRNGRDDDGDMEVDECSGGDFDGVATWWGLCHAWVPASILEDEPLHPVTYGGQTFEVGDIHALLITAYDRTESIMLGGRCNEMITERPTNDDRTAIPEQCRDTNPGAFHVVVTNFLGLRHQAIAEDRTFDAQVWNQPFVGYEITMQEEIDLARANELLGMTGDTYAPNAAAKRFYEIKLTTDYITESYAPTEPTTPRIARYTQHDRYHYILELDQNGKILGGEWVEGSRFNHPDFLWLPIRAARYGANPNVNLDQVRMLRDLARRDDTGGGDATSETTTTETSVAIPDNDPAGATARLTYPDATTIGQVTATVKITHTYIGDLHVELRHGATSVVLMDHEGGSTDNIDKSFTVDDFAGQDASGEWTLFVSDNAGQDTGTIDHFAVSVTAGSAPIPPTAAGTSYENTSAVAIPDNTPAGVSLTVDVPAGTTVNNLAVDLDIAHTYIGDLTITLEHAGTVVTLSDRAGGSTDNLVTTYTPTDFDASDATGVWTLKVVDSAAQDEGTLNSVKLTFNR